METNRTRLIAMVVAGTWLAGSASMAAIVPTSDDFSGGSIGDWVSVGSTPADMSFDTPSEDYDRNDLLLPAGTEATGDGVRGDGGLRLNTGNATKGDEAIGLTIAGTMELGEILRLTISEYNDNGSYYYGTVQLYNLTDGRVLAESGSHFVKSKTDVTYAPVPTVLQYAVRAEDEGDTLQIRLVEDADSDARDAYLDCFALADVASDGSSYDLLWTFDADTGSPYYSYEVIRENTDSYDYTSDTVYDASNAVANTLAFRANGTGADYWVAKKRGAGHEKCLFWRTISPNGAYFGGPTILKMDFTLGGRNSTNLTKVSWSFDILGSGHAGIVPTNWVVRLNCANSDPGIGNTPTTGFTTNNSVLVQTFAFKNTDLNTDWTTVTGSYTIAIGEAGNFGGLMVNADRQGAYTSGDGIYLDNIHIAIESAAPVLGDLYESWIAGFGLGGADTNTTANPDGDLLDNLAEYGMGGNPTNSGDMGYHTVTAVAEDGGTNWFYYVHPQRNDAAIAGLGYSLESNADLTVPSGWVNATYEIVGIAKDGFGANFNAVTNRIPADGETKRFIRLMIDGL